ncbi:hypothetical protein OG613_48040 (plasmid) [Streptomyces sp. NBC_00015]|uniref:hypothetical protein n=1 Tax=Streptomyces sp. NBC_00015 TaxID=2903611 RepID=UPI002F912881
MLWRPLAFSRFNDADQPRTVTYYGPRVPAIDPRFIPTDDDQVAVDVRQVVGDQLPAGFDWVPRRPNLTVIKGGDPMAPGPDETMACTVMIRAIARWGVRAA